MIRYVSLTLVGIEKLNKDTDIFFFFKRVQNRLSQSVKDFIIFIVIRHIASRILTFSLGELTRKVIPFFQFFVQSLSTRCIESFSCVDTTLICFLDLDVFFFRFLISSLFLCVFRFSRRKCHKSDETMRYPKDGESMRWKREMLSKFERGKSILQMQDRLRSGERPMRPGYDYHGCQCNWSTKRHDQFSRYIHTQYNYKYYDVMNHRESFIRVFSIYL